MSRFYGTVQGNRGQATRRGINTMVTYCASWHGAIRCCAFNRNGEDWVTVTMEPWQGEGEERLIYRGPMGQYRPHGMRKIPLKLPMELAALTTQENDNE